MTTVGWVTGAWVTAMMGWWCAGRFSGVSWFYLLQVPANCGPVVEMQPRYAAEDNPGENVTLTDSLARASV